MAYEKQTWQTGDVITQEKLNHMEDGIANVGGGAEFVKLIENANLSFGENQSYAGGGKAFVDGKTFGELIGNKTVIGFMCTELTRTDGTEGVWQVFLADFIVSALGTGAAYGSVLINQNTDAVRNTTGGSYVCTRTAINYSVYGTIDVYAICI